MNNYFVTCISNCYEMKEEELLYALALQKVKGVGDIHAKKLIEVCGSPKNVFVEKHQVLQKINGVGSVLLRQLSNKENLLLAENELKLIEKNDLVPRYFLDDNYPRNLKNCIDAPFLFFQDGNFDLNQKKILSVVGTRNMTNYGRDFCEELIENIKPYDPIIVSGFAYGVDICAHKAAMKNELTTIGVFAHGFGQVYPKPHKKYMAQMSKNGGFLTEFWFDEQPLRENFLKRNRIVAGISEATVVVESATRGGALATASIANSYARDVFALPGRSTDTYSKGCNNLIKKNKAALITSAEDLIEMLGWEQTQTTKIIQPKLFVELTSDEQVIMEYLSKNNKELLDVISLDCNFLVHRTATILFQLEMKGLLRALPGKMFEII